MRWKLLTAAALSLLPAFAAAQGYDELDEPQDKPTPSRHRGDRNAVVREIVKGYYAKADVGSAMYLGRFNGYVQSGTAVSLAVGVDFIDHERFSMAAELDFAQGIHNGMHYTLQADAGCGIAPCVEGDLRTYSGLAILEASWYPQRRVGLGGRLGGGALYSPLLMEDTAYQNEVVSLWGTDPGIHDIVHPVGLGGFTFEYYSKLSHFSVGADVDAFYAIGFDLGMNVEGYMKYTF